MTGEKSRLYFLASLVAADCENVAVIFSQKLGDPFAPDSDGEDDEANGELRFSKRSFCSLVGKDLVGVRDAGP